MSVAFTGSLCLQLIFLNIKTGQGLNPHHTFHLTCSRKHLKKDFIIQLKSAHPTLKMHTLTSKSIGVCIYFNLIQTFVFSNSISTLRFIQKKTKTPEFKGFPLYQNCCLCMVEANRT